MNPTDFHLVIHHHMPAYRDRAGTIYLPSTLGRWVNVLAPHFGRLTLLAYQTEEKRVSQDTEIVHSNVALKSLGPPGIMWDRIPRMRRLRRACRELSGNVDGLLIRGMTPRQYNVWKHVNTPHKGFLLVGSMQRKPKWSWTFRELLSYIYHWYRPWELHQMVKRGTFLMVNSLALVDEVHAAWGFAPPYIPTSSIQVDEVAPCLPRPLNTDRRLLFVGRVVPDKGIQELLASASDLIHAGEIHRVDIVGPVSNEIRERIGIWVSSSDIEKQILVHGPIPYGETLFTYYRQADILVLPSYSEGFPHVLWEAAASSCPIIATNVGGIPRLWQDGVHGILVPPRDVNSLITAIRRMLRDDEFRSACVRQAYALAQQHTAEASARALVNVLAQVW